MTVEKTNKRRRSPQAHPKSCHGNLAGLLAHFLEFKRDRCCWPKFTAKRWGNSHERPLELPVYDETC